MSRSVNNVAAKRRKKKILRAAKGNFGARSKLFRSARETVEKGWQYAYRDRKAKKREFRRLWIVRINAAARMNGLSYSQMIHGLQLADVTIDRKVLAYIAYTDMEAFVKLCDLAKENIQ